MSRLRINLGGERVSTEAEETESRGLGAVRGDLGVRAIEGARRSILDSKVQGLRNMREQAKEASSSSVEDMLARETHEKAEYLEGLAAALRPGGFHLDIVFDKDGTPTATAFFEDRPEADVTELLSPGGIVERVKVHANGDEDRTTFAVYKLSEGSGGDEPKVVLKSSKGMRTPIVTSKITAPPDSDGSYWKILPPRSVDSSAEA